MKLKSIVFDFDGVITESMDIKTRAFAYLFRNYSEDTLNKILKLHLDNGGMTRFDKFKIIYRDYLNKPLFKKEKKNLDRAFSDFCYNEIIKCPYVAGVKEFLEKNYKDYLFFIVSGTPNDEINQIIDKRKLRKYFKGVWGSPRTKGDLLKMILHEYNLRNEEVVFIGDSPTDYLGAKGADIKFIARIALGEYNPFNKDEFEIQYTIKDFSDINKILKTMKNDSVMKNYT